MKNLYVYYFRKRVPVILASALAFIVLTIIFLSQNEFLRYVREIDASGKEIIKYAPGDNPFLYLSILICVVATVVPVMEFSFKMKRRSVDLFYSLPITRVKLYAVKYLLGLSEVLLVCLPQWIVSLIFVACKPNVFLLYYYLWYGLSAIGFGILIYTFMAFFYTMANSFVDGLIFMLMASCFLAVFIHMVSSFVSLVDGGAESNILFMRFYFIYSPFIDTSMALYYKMCGTYAENTGYQINLPALLSIIALGIASGVLFFLFHSIKNNAESISDDSSSWFGYRIMIPAYMVTSFTLAGKFSPLWVIVAMTGYVAYAIYRKNFKIKKRDLFAYAISVVFGLIFASIL